MLFQRARRSNQESLETKEGGSGDLLEVCRKQSQPPHTHTHRHTHDRPSHLVTVWTLDLLTLIFTLLFHKDRNTLLWSLRVYYICCWASLPWIHNQQHHEVKVGRMIWSWLKLSVEQMRRNKSNLMPQALIQNVKIEKIFKKRQFVNSFLWDLVQDTNVLIWHPRLGAFILMITIILIIVYFCLRLLMCWTSFAANVANRLSNKHQEASHCSDFYRSWLNVVKLKHTKIIENYNQIVLPICYVTKAVLQDCREHTSDLKGGGSWISFLIKK